MLASWIRSELQEVLDRQGEHGLVVWYDPNGTLEGLLEEALPEGVKILRFEGSYLALRFALEAEDPNFQKRWVVYVPESSPDESWLWDWELLGKRLKMDLLGLLKRRCGLGITQKLKELLRSRSRNARELVARWDEVMGDREVTEQALIEALLTLCFELSRWDLHDALLKFIAKDGWQERLEERGLWKEWCKKVEDWTGWSEPPGDEPALRQRLEASILLSELVEAVPEYASRWTLVPQEKHRREEMAELARKWREHEPLREAYMRSALDMEREYELGGVLTVGEPLLKVETFRIVDELWQRELRNAIAKDGANFADRAERIRNIAEARKGLFWARYERELGHFWEALSLSASLFIGCRKAVQEVERLNRIEEFVDRYTIDDGWWHLDSLALRLAAIQEHLSRDDNERFLRPAWVAYGDYLKRVNRAFADAVEVEGWRPTQTGFWRKFRRKRGRKVTFLVDALRFDLAQHLREKLRGYVNFKIEPVRTTLPSITELGMSALLPDAEKGLRVALQEDALCVSIGNKVISTKEERQRWLKDRLGDSGRVVTLDELERVNLDNISTLVVVSRKVDEFGTFAADLHPQGLLELTERIVRAVRFVVESGFEHVWVVADHGFLFIPSNVRLETLSAPKAITCKRRFALGASAEGCIMQKAHRLGLDGDVIFAFPKGVDVFALPGELGAFLHGGLSLQECIVASMYGKVAAPIRKVRVKMTIQEPITSRTVLMTVSAEFVTLFDQPRRVKVKIGERESEPVEVSPNSPQAQMSLSWVEFDEEPPREVKISLQDADTGEVLDERMVNVEMAV